MYTSLVRPILEYATQVWDPYQKSLLYKIEMIQRRAARWVFSNYDFHSSVSSMLKDLNWSTLEERRKASRLTLLSRIVHIKSQPYKCHNTFCHRPPPPDNSTNYILYYHHHTLNIIKNAFFTELLKNGMGCHHLVMTNSSTNIYKSINFSVAPICIFHIYRYRLFAYFCNRYADIYRYSSILQNRRGGAENHLEFMFINCICNINVINCEGGRLLPFFYSFAINSFHGKGSQVVIKQLRQLIKQCF